ncbi:MAG: hypothetical protein ACRC2S_09340 [Waterburya sp.]
MNYPQVTNHQSLNSCIQIMEVKINRRLTLPRQINFRLNADILKQIEYIKAQNQQLKLSKSKLTTLRYYTLLNSSLESKANLVQERLSPLNFTTSYIFSDNQQLTVIRSLIDVKGQISQQIQQDLWHNPQLLERVVDAHHWLIGQILIQLPLKTPRLILLLLHLLLAIVWVIVTMYLWYFLPLNNSVKILIIFCLFYLAKKHLITLIKQQVKTYFLKAMFKGLLANTTQKRQIALNILSTLV